MSLTTELISGAPVTLLPKSRILKNGHVAEPVRQILIIDDDPDFADALRALLERFGQFRVSTALDPFEGANQLADHRFDVVVTDFNLQDWNGVTTLENADHLIDVDPTVMDQWSNLNRVKVLFCSSAPIRLQDLKRANKLRHFCVMGFLPKGCGLESIYRSVAQLTQLAGA